MIKFIVDSKREGKKLIGIGLSDGNMELLKQNKPIVIDLCLEDFKNYDIDTILIIGGGSEKEMIEEMKKVFHLPKIFRVG